MVSSTVVEEPALIGEETPAGAATGAVAGAATGAVAGAATGAVAGAAAGAVTGAAAAPAVDRADSDRRAAEREPIRFFLPGPVYVRRHVREAMLEPVVGHRSPDFKARYASIARRLPPIFRTAGEVYTATGSATLLMEAAVISTVRRRVLNLTSGAFSERWHAVCRCLGLEADTVAVPWGEAIDPELVRRALARGGSGTGGGYEAVTVVHNETSTGVLNPLPEIARAVREGSDALLLADSVSGLGGAALEVDGWGVDIAFTGSQKALAAPPGVVPFTLSRRAGERAAALAHRGFYTDLLRYRDKHRAGGTITTPAMPVYFALDRQLAAIEQEGIEARWARHLRLRRKTERWAEAAGCRYASIPAAPSPTVSCLRPPEGWSAPQVVAAAARAGFTIASGYGAFKQETFRIGHMGEVTEWDLAALFDALDDAFERGPR